MQTARHHPARARVAATSNRRGFTLVEGIVAIAVFSLLMIVVTTQLVESLTLSLKTSTGLEHARSTRSILDMLGTDLRCSQTIILHTSFADRSENLRDGQYADYLVLHQLDQTGAINRTIGYYTVTAADGTRTLYRHDSADDHSSAGELPGTNQQGTHRVVSRSIRIAEQTRLFRCTGDRGIAVRGQFGSPDGNVRVPAQFIQCALVSRS
jgi:prepilin-type N-terminal cleavage/methylation domain-containing protein